MPRSQGPSNGEFMTKPNVQVSAVSDSKFGLPVCWFQLNSPPPPPVAFATL